MGVDVTLVSPLHADGTAWAGAADNPDIALQRAKRDKDSAYPALVDSPVLRLITVACETGGRWNDTMASVLKELAHARTRDAPQIRCDHGLGQATVGNAKTNKQKQSKASKKQ